MLELTCVSKCPESLDCILYRGRHEKKRDLFEKND